MTHRIAFVSAMDSAPWGGSEELWSQAAKILLNQGHSILACVKMWSPRPPQVRALADARATVVERDCGVRPLPLRVIRGIKRRLKGTSEADRAGVESCRRIQNFRPDLVCISQGSNTDGLDWMLWCRKEKIPYVSVMQANAEHLWPCDGHAEELALAHKQALATYFVSEANLRLFECQIGFRLSNAQVIRNPYNVGLHVAPSWPASDLSWKLACVGRLAPMAKGQDLILQTLALPAWRDRSLSVSFFGSGEMERSLCRLAAILGVEHKVCFHGQVNEIEAIWAAHHALLLPSRYEGLPLALVEAMLCHRLAIVTDVAGNAEMVEDGIHGFVAQSPNVSALTEAMERAWQCRSNWREMGLAAGRHIRNLVPESPAAAFSLALTDLITGKRQGIMIPATASCVSLQPDSVLLE